MDRAARHQGHRSGDRPAHRERAAGGPIATPDDLLVYKLVAGRPQDLADIDRMLRLGVAPEDEAYVRRWADEWQVVDRLDAALTAAAAMTV